jgi:hypothetical protein
MKTSVRNEDAITRAMGWLEQLREDGRAELVSERGDEPATVGVPPTDVTARPPNADSGGPEMCEGAEMIEPAPIGDALRMPIAWCEMDSCISHYEHPAALGEGDIRPVRSRLVGESMRWAGWLARNAREVGPGSGPLIRSCRGTGTGRSAPSP